MNGMDDRMTPPSAYTICRARRPRRSRESRRPCARLAGMDLWKEAVVASAAFAAGLINSIAGGGTLVSFPALLWTGRDPVLANATSTVALWPASLAGVYGFRRELKGGARLFLLFGAPSLAGGVLGAVLLLRTP